jgi:hypothetical protein
MHMDATQAELEDVLAQIEDIKRDDKSADNTHKLAAKQEAEREDALRDKLLEQLFAYLRDNNVPFHHQAPIYRPQSRRTRFGRTKPDPRPYKYVDAWHVDGKGEFEDAAGDPIKYHANLTVTCDGKFEPAMESPYAPQPWATIPSIRMAIAMFVRYARQCGIDKPWSGV